MPPMSFHLGKPILVMMVLAGVTGAATWVRREPAPKGLTLWVFADAHYSSYKPEIARYGQESGILVDMQIVQVHAMGRRLQAIFADELIGSGVPDVVEVEVGQVGKFFRPPNREIGFEPLQPMLERSGWYDQIVPARFAPWTRHGTIFGVPHDVHPVGITYREDLFREAGIDLAAAKTWPDFQQACLAFQRYWAARGFKTRHALELYAARVDLLNLMLLQRGVNLVDDFDRIHMADPKVASTLAFYAQCVAGPTRIGSEAGEGDGPFTRDLLDGNLCAFFTPDWRIGLIKQFGGQTLNGKLRFMPLPRFDPADAPTASWGGTMIAILRGSQHKDEAWKLIERLYFDRAGVEARRALTQILPPVTPFWNDPSYHKPDPYFGGQHLDEQLIALAGELPPRYVTPMTNIANLYLMQVLHRATRLVEETGTQGLDVACQRLLNTAAADLADRMKQWEFEGGSPAESAGKR